MPEQHEPIMRTICMDCHAVIREGDPGTPVSHGICDQCLPKRWAEVDELIARLQAEDHAA